VEVKGVGRAGWGKKIKEKGLASGAIGKRRGVNNDDRALEKGVEVKEIVHNL